MKAAISVNHAVHQKEHGEAMRAGLARHGIDSVFTHGDTPIDAVDFHVTWSIKRPKIFRWRERTGRHVLVMERGYLPDRMVYSSIGWDGLNNRAVFPAAPDGGRWERHFADHMKPWRRTGGKTALLCGQVPGDSALYGLDLNRWAQSTADRLATDGWDVIFRPHPLTLRQGTNWTPRGCLLAAGGSLQDALDHADLCVTYNSNSGVEAVLHGTPTVTLDEGAMAWGVSAHDFHPVTPDRTEWAHRLAWCQWTLEEIERGDAWEALRSCI